MRTFTTKPSSAALASYHAAWPMVPGWSCPMPANLASDARTSATAREMLSTGAADGLGWGDGRGEGCADGEGEGRTVMDGVTEALGEG